MMTENVQESLPIADRVVVFGSRSSVDFDLDKALDLYSRERNIHESVFIADRYVVERDIDNIPNAFYGRREATADTLPKGVVVLPSMYWNPEGRGMFVDTHEGQLYADKAYETVFAYIKSICDENRVPLADFSKAPTQAEFTLGLSNLLNS